MSEFGISTYSGADWLKSTGLPVRKKQIKLSGNLREMVYKAARCSYMLKISKTHFFLGHPVDSPSKDGYFGKFCRRRQNLLTFREMTWLYRGIIFYVHLESAVFLLMYKYQDRIGTDGVFYIIHTLYVVFDFSLLVCV